MEKKLTKILKSKATKIVRIAIFGPESTGKTTLAKQLAEHYQTTWVPEFARDYLQEKLDSGKGICELSDMLPIAYGQANLEKEKSAVANKYLFCDTNLMVTKVFSELYYQYCDPLLDAAARSHHYDLYFLTDIDVPWEADGLRDSPEGRDSVFSVFQQALIDNQKPYLTLTGDVATRLKKAISIIDELQLARELGLNSLDFVQIYEHGIPLERINKQYEIYTYGISKTYIDRPAIVGDGIWSMEQNEFDQNATYYDQNKSDLKILKFVPASGAATRMFKFLNEFLNDFDVATESVNAYINRKNDLELSLFLLGMDKFPFFNTINSRLRNEIIAFDDLSTDYKQYFFIVYMLRPEYFNFSNKPKGVLPFHSYVDYVLTPFEEHLKECVSYACNKQKGYLHFTITQSHQVLFEQLEKDIKPQIENDTQTSLRVDYTYQSRKTDTVAVDSHNKWVKNENGKLLFKPGGHGALIENLNIIDADIIFVKNIDNVIQNHNEEVALYKKALAGQLLKLQRQIFDYCEKIEQQKVTETELKKIISFTKKNLNIELLKGFSKFTFENQVEELYRILNRPIRVCGMVKNEGEPGGGPFWVTDKEGITSLQIVETSQIDLNNEMQQQFLEQATHFNPVDLVCGIKDFKNQKFDLTQFVDPFSGFVVERTTGEKTLKSYELPGLWNGAMANWITIFVEVPMITFNPVKNVNDLLKPAHQLENTL
jgi:nicotinamide riboside kinase